MKYRDIKYKWQKEIAERVNQYDNATLFNEILSLAAGDDYDGWTTRGAWKQDYMISRFANTLHEYGVVNENGYKTIVAEDAELEERWEKGLIEEEKEFERKEKNRKRK